LPALAIALNRRPEVHAMGLRFLVVEGNTRQAREGHEAAWGLTPARSYAEVLRGIAPMTCDIVCPADEGARLPNGGLSDYDAVVLTGSALHLWRGGPEVERQVDLMRAVYAAGVPAFGSCWGLQIGAAAAGGEVRPNPRGREVGFARNIAATAAGQAHPLLAGRPAAFAAPAVHLDAVAVPPPGCTILAANPLAHIQAAEIRAGEGVMWGVQYHPEFSLPELAVILRRIAALMVAEGFCRTPEEAEAYADEVAALEVDRADLAWRHGLDAEVLEPVRRTREIRNFVEHLAQPRKSARGRA
jgi:GMP synthase (glutamine-hydrolysing)